MGQFKVFTPKVKETLELISSVSGMQKFFIQDTETTGLDRNSEIYEFAGVLYDGSKTGDARFTKVHYYLRPSNTTLAQLKAQGLAMEKQGQKNPWGEMSIDDETLNDMERTGKRHPVTGGVFVSNATFKNKTMELFNVPQITYNAVFDINKELNYLPANYKLNTDIYDASTMVVDLFPQIVQDARFEGKWNLQKIYNVLCHDYKKIIGIPGKTFPGSYGGKRLSAQRHTAISDVVDMLVPVLGAISDYIKKHPDWKFTNYKGKQFYSVNRTVQGADGKTTFKTHEQYESDVADALASLHRAKLSGTAVPWKLIQDGFYKAGSIAKGKNAGIKQVDGIKKFLSALPDDIRTGAIHLNRFNSLDGGRAATMASLTKDIMGKGQYSTTTLIKSLDSELKKNGLVPQYQYNRGTGTVTVYLIPENKGMLADIIDNQKEIPSFRFFLARSDGSINLFTKAGTAYKGVNGLYSDYQNGKGFVVTAEQLQLMELVKAAKYASGDPEKTARNLTFALRKSGQTLEALQQYVTGDTEQELSHEKSGAGSAIQLKARLGFLRNQRFVVHLVDEYQSEILDLFWKNDPRANRRGNKQDCLIDIYTDINDIVNQLGTFGAKMGNHAITKEKRYDYLRKNPAIWNHIKRVINSSIGRLQFEPGSAGENSVGHMSVSLTSPATLNLFGLSPMDRQHSKQSAHYHAAGQQSRKMRQERQSLVTEALLHAGVKPNTLEAAYAKIQFATTSDYTKAYQEVKQAKMRAGMSEAEFIREYGTPQHGIHSGGSIYARNSRFEKEYLDAAKENTGVVDVTAVYEWLFRHRRNYFDIDKEANQWKVDSQGYIVTNPKYSEKQIDKWWKEAVIAVGRFPTDAGFDSNNAVLIDNGTKWRIHYKTNKAMNGAGKVLVGGFDERTMATGIHPEIFKQILKDKGLSVDNTEILLNPDGGAFGSKHMSGLLGSYLNAIVAHGKQLILKSGGKKMAAQRNKEVLNMINKEKPLSGILYFDDKTKSLIIRNGAWEKAIQTYGMEAIYNSLNHLGSPIFGGDGFEKKDGQWRVTKNWRGYAAVNQAELYEYGAPGGRVVSFDYRAQQAVHRSMNIAGLKGSLVEKTLIAGMSATAAQLKNYEKAKKTVQRALEESQNSVMADFNTDKLAECVCIGWKHVPAGGIDLASAEFSTSIRTEGKFDPEKYAKSVYGAIDAARKRKAQQLGKKPEDIMVYVDLQESFAESQKYAGSDRLYGNAVRYLFLPNFSQMGAEKNSKDYIQMPSFEQEFNSLLHNIQHYNSLKESNFSDADIAKARSQVGNKIFAFQHAMIDDVFHKEGATYRRYNSIRATHSASMTAAAGNYTLVNDREFSPVERKLAATSGLLSWEDMFTLVNSDETREAKTQAAKQKAMLGHITVLQETLRQLWAGQEAEVPAILKRFVDKYIKEDCATVELMSDRFHRGEEALRDKLSQEGKTLPQINAAMKNYRERCEKEKKEKLLSIQDKLKLTLKNVLTADASTLLKLTSNDPIEQLFAAFPMADEDVKTGIYRLVNEVLSAFIVESVTLGSNVFEKRSDKNKMQGMSGVFMRYPLSNGLDVQFTDFYVDKAGVVKGTIIMGQGTGHETHLDYDGDHPPMWLPFIDANTLGKSPAAIKKNLQRINQEFDTLKTVNQRMRSGLAFLDRALLGEDDANTYNIKEGVESEFSKESFMNQVAAIFAGRKYKGDVGRLSNTYQAVTNAFYEHKLDETGIKQNSKRSKLRALKTMALRAIFETLTQDAISSKKVYNRLKGANGQNVLYDLENLLEKIHESLTYNTDTGLAQLFSMLRKMQLGDMETRIIYNIVAVGQQIDPSGEILDMLLGKGNGSRFLMQFDENNQVTSFGGLTGQNDVQARIKEMTALFNSNFEQDIIKSSDQLLRKMTEKVRKGGESLSTAMNLRKYRVGMGQANAYSLSIGRTSDGKEVRIVGITQAQIDRMRPEVQKLFKDALYEQRLADKDRGVGSNTVTNAVYGNSLAVSLDDILNDNTNSYKMYSVHTRLDTSHGQHRNYIDESRYNPLQYNKMKDLKVYSVTQIASSLHIGGESKNVFPVEYGTFFHAIIEAIAKGEIPMNADYKVDPNDLRAWIERVWKGENPNYDRTDVIVAIESNPDHPDVWRVSPTMLSTIAEKTNVLIENLRVEYPDAFSSVNEVRTKLSVMSETTHGIVVRLGNRNVVISGTIDQIWMGYKELDNEISSMSISDIKTSKYAYLEYVVQLSLYGAILRAYQHDRGSGILVDSKGKLTLNPRGGSMSGVVNVEMLSDEELLKFVEEAIHIVDMPPSEEKQVEILKLARKWNPYLVNKLELTAGMQTVDSSGKQQFIIGGSELSAILNRHSDEMPLTQLENRLWDDYVIFSKGGDPKAQRGFEPFVLAQLKAGNITEEQYQQHILFRAARGQYLADYVGRITNDGERNKAIEQILGMRAHAPENSIVYDFGFRLGYLKPHGASKTVTAIRKADVQQFYDASIDASTYNYKSLFPSSGEEDDDVAKTNELIDALMATLVQFKNGNGTVGHASAAGGGSSGSSDITLMGNNTNEVFSSTQALDSYTDLLKKQKLYNLELYKYDPNSADYKNTYSKIENISNQLNSSTFTEMKNRYGEAWDKNVDTMLKKDEDFKVKREQAQNDLLEERAKLLEKIAKLDADIREAQEQHNVATEKQLKLQKEGLEQRVLSAEELHKLGFTDDQIGGIGGDGSGAMAQAKEADRERSAALSSYKRLITERGRNAATAYDLSLTYKTTYDKVYKQSILEQMDNVAVQNKMTEEEIKTLVEKFQNDPAFEAERRKIDKIVEAETNVRMGRVNVKHKGQDTLWGQLGSQMTNIITRFTQMGAAYKIIGKVREGFNTVIQSAKNLDKALTDLRIVTGQTGDEASSTMQKFSKLAGELGVATTEVATAGTAWLRQGYDMVQVNDLITSSMYLSRLGMISVDEATKDLTSSLKGFKLEAKDAMSVVDKLTALDVKAATTAGEIATGLAQFANLANLNGISIDQASAMVATIADVSQVSGAQAGNSLKMMLSRYGTVKSGKFDTMAEGDEQTSLNDVEKVLNRIGVSIRNSNLEFREFDEVLEDIADKWDTLDNISQNAIATALAGTRQREAFLVLMSNMDKYHSLRQVSETSEGTAERKYQSYSEQLEASQKRLIAAWEEFASSADVAKFLKLMNDLMAKLVKILPTIVKYVARWIAMTQAYKLPGIMDNMGLFAPIQRGIALGKQGLGRLQNSKFSPYGRIRNAFGFGSDDGKPLSARERQMQRIEDYYNDQEGNSLFARLSKPVSDLVTALNNNTKALGGETDATNKNTDATDGSAKNTQDNTKSLQDNTSSLDENTNAENASTVGGTGGQPTQQPNPKNKGSNWKAKAGTAMQVAASGISAAMTAETNQFDVFGMGSDWDTTTRSQGLRMGAAINEGAATAVASYFLGPMGGMLVSTLFDKIINPTVLPLLEQALDNDSYQSKLLERSAKHAEENMQLISNLADQANVLTKLSSEDLLMGEQYTEAAKSLDAIINTVFKDKNSTKLWQQLVSNTDLANKSIIDFRKSYLSGSQREREMLAATLQAALAWQEAREFAATQDIKQYEVAMSQRTNRKIRSGFSGFATLTPNQFINSYMSSGIQGNKGHLGNGWDQIVSNALGSPASAMMGVVSPDPLVSLALYATNLGTSIFNTSQIEKNNLSNFILNNSKYGAGLSTRNTTFEAGKEWYEYAASFLPLLFGVPAIGMTSETTLEMTDQMYLEALGDYRDSLEDQLAVTKEGTEEYDKLIDKLKDVNTTIDDVNKSLQQQRLIYDQINSKYAAAAVASASFTSGYGRNNKAMLTTMGTGQLKHLGKDEIMNLVAQELLAQGGLMGFDVYRDGKLTQEAYDYILTALKSDNKIWGVISGGSYSLSELLTPGGDASKDSQMQATALRQFADALGVSVDKLSELEGTFGHLTLAQVIASPEETRTSISELTGLFTSMATSTGLSAENIETIINKFPELIQYLGDTTTLAEKISEETSTLVDLYGRNLFNNLIKNEAYFEQFKATLQKEDMGLFDALVNSSNKTFANAKNFSDISEILYGNASDYGLTAEQQQALRDRYGKAFDVSFDNTVERERITTIMSYQSKMYERQIKNLEEQKQALQDINKQREYENKLIEAKLKLEDAQKEKKRVWREGVGWTYESDQKALEEAERNLNDVRNEKKVSELDAEISRLQAEKDFIDNLPSEQELKNMREVYEGWAKQVELNNASQKEILEKIAEFYKGIEKINMGEFAEQDLANKEQEQQKVEAEASRLLDIYIKANEKYDALVKSNADRTSDEFKQAEKARNEALQAYQNYVSGNSSNISSSWYENTEGAQGAAEDVASYKAEDVVYLSSNSSGFKNDKKFRMDAGTLSSTSDTYKILQGDMNKGKAVWWKTDSTHLNAEGSKISISGSQMSDYYEKSLAEWAKDPNHQNTILWNKSDHNDGKRWVYIKNQQVYKLNAFKKGTLGSQGGPAMLNEQGTEAIITPQGTITSLPSSSGVVPADITRGVWQLGELAPEILRSLGYPNVGGSGTGPINNSDSVNIGTVNMTVSADASFDPQKFVEALKQQASLNKNNRR